MTPAAQHQCQNAGIFGAWRLPSLSLTLELGHWQAKQQVRHLLFNFPLCVIYRYYSRACTHYNRQKYVLQSKHQFQINSFHVFSSNVIPYIAATIRSTPGVLPAKVPATFLKFLYKQVHTFERQRCC